MAQIKSGISTAAKLAAFREECRKYYSHLRSPHDTKTRMDPNPQLFNGYAMEMARRIKEEEKLNHEKLLSKQK